MIEIDLTASSLSRNPIFAAIGVPEVWRYAKDSLTILTLAEGEYTEQAESVTIPRLTPKQIEQWLHDLATVRRAAWTKSIRQWAEENQPEPLFLQVAPLFTCE